MQVPLLALLCLVAALICAVFSAFVIPNPQPARPRFGWLSFALFLGFLLAYLYKV